MSHFVDIIDTLKKKNKHIKLLGIELEKNNTKKSPLSSWSYYNNNLYARIYFRFKYVYSGNNI